MGKPPGGKGLRRGIAGAGSSLLTLCRMRGGWGSGGRMGGLCIHGFDPRHSRTLHGFVGPPALPCRAWCYGVLFKPCVLRKSQACCHPGLFLADRSCSCTLQGFLQRATPLSSSSMTALLCMSPCAVPVRGCRCGSCCKRSSSRPSGNTSSSFSSSSSSSSSGSDTRGPWRLIG